MAGQTTTGEHAAHTAAAALAAIAHDVQRDVETDRWDLAMEHCRSLDRLLSEVQASIVYVARERGASWTHIGKMFGVPRQTAHRRWADLT